MLTRGIGHLLRLLGAAKVKVSQRSTCSCEIMGWQKGGEPRHEANTKMKSLCVRKWRTDAVREEEWDVGGIYEYMLLVPP